MREAAVPGYRLRKGRHSTKILISLGLIGLLLGLLSSALLTISRTGLTPAHVKQYYLGIDESVSDLTNIDIASTARPFAELIEVTHLHLLGGSILLFLLCHLLSLCDVKDSARTTLYVLSFVSFLVTFTLPWLIIYLHSGFAWLFGPSIVIFLISLFIVSFIPLREMWGHENR